MTNEAIASALRKALDRSFIPGYSSPDGEFVRPDHYDAIKLAESVKVIIDLLEAGHG